MPGQSRPIQPIPFVDSDHRRIHPHFPEDRRTRQRVSHVCGRGLLSVAAHVRPPHPVAVRRAEASGQEPEERREADEDAALSGGDRLRDAAGD